jgi:parallel beta-helix repeat protein
MKRACWFALASVLLGCSGDETAEPIPTEDPCPGCTKLSPSADDQTALQTALIQATAGQVIYLEAGRYDLTAELSLSVHGVTVRGAGKDQTILDFTGQTTGANGLAITGDDVVLEHLAIKNTPGDGVRATDVTNIAFMDMAVGWDAAASLENGAYGLYPVGSEGVRIERSTVYGARDAGVYVGQSTNILVSECDVYGNVAGIEIENSTGAEVTRNLAHDNTAGILVFNLPNLPVQDGKHAKVHANEITTNNLKNFAAEGTIVSRVPAGTGVFLLATDENEIHDNHIEGNRTVAALVLGYTALIGTFDDPGFDPYAQGNYIHDNEFVNNGYDPVVLGALIDVRPIPDIVTDGCEDPATAPATDALVNCVGEPGGATYININQADSLCDADVTPTQDLAAVTCEHPSLPSQDP